MGFSWPYSNSEIPTCAHVTEIDAGYHLFLFLSGFILSFFFFVAFFFASFSPFCNIWNWISVALIFFVLIQWIQYRYDQLFIYWLHWLIIHRSLNYKQWITIKSILQIGNWLMKSDLIVIKFELAPRQVLWVQVCDWINWINWINWIDGIVSIDSYTDEADVNDVIHVLRLLRVCRPLKYRLR